MHKQMPQGSAHGRRCAAGTAVAVVAAVLVAVMPLAGRAADWPCFRGAGHDGVSPDAGVPTSWSADRNVRWKAKLPRTGNSGPVVVGGRVFVTSALEAKGRERALLCFDRETGRQLWQRAVTYEKADPTDKTNPYCSSSPAADESRVVAWHGSAGLFCYDHDGNLLWSRTDLGETRHGLGYGSSPVMHRGAVLLNFGPGVATAVYSIDAATGRTRWRTPEVVEASDWVGSWATPVVVAAGGREVVVVPLPLRVNAYDVETGTVAWSVGGLTKLVYTDVVWDAAAGLGVAMSGYNGPAIGFRLGDGGAAGAAAAPAATAPADRRTWRVEKNPQRIGTGVVIAGHVYLAHENGLQCIDMATGREAWRHRPLGANGRPATFWSPAAAVGDRVYVTARDGTTHVFRADPRAFVPLSENPLGEQINGAPALSGRQIFLRGVEHL